MLGRDTPSGWYPRGAAGLRTLHRWHSHIESANTLANRTPGCQHRGGSAARVIPAIDAPGAWYAVGRPNGPPRTHRVRGRGTKRGLPGDAPPFPFGRASRRPVRSAGTAPTTHHTRGWVRRPPWGSRSRPGATLSVKRLPGQPGCRRRPAEPHARRNPGIPPDRGRSGAGRCDRSRPPRTSGSSR